MSYLHPGVSKQKMNSNDQLFTPKFNNDSNQMLSHTLNPKMNPDYQIQKTQFEMFKQDYNNKNGNKRPGLQVEEQKAIRVNSKESKKQESKQGKVKNEDLQKSISKLKKQAELQIRVTQQKLSQQQRPFRNQSNNKKEENSQNPKHKFNQTKTPTKQEKAVKFQDQIVNQALLQTNQILQSSSPYKNITVLQQQPQNRNHRATNSFSEIEQDTAVSQSFTIQNINLYGFQGDNEQNQYQIMQHDSNMFLDSQNSGDKKSTLQQQSPTKYQVVTSLDDYHIVNSSAGKQIMKSEQISDSKELKNSIDFQQVSTEKQSKKSSIFSKYTNLQDKQNQQPQNDIIKIDSIDLSYKNFINSSQDMRNKILRSRQETDSSFQSDNCNFMQEELEEQIDNNLLQQVKQVNNIINLQTGDREQYSIFDSFEDQDNSNKNRGKKIEAQKQIGSKGLKRSGKHSNLQNYEEEEKVSRSDNKHRKSPMNTNKQSAEYRNIEDTEYSLKRKSLNRKQQQNLINRLSINPKQSREKETETIQISKPKAKQLKPRKKSRSSKDAKAMRPLKSFYSTMKVELDQNNHKHIQFQSNQSPQKQLKKVKISSKQVLSSCKKTTKEDYDEFDMDEFTEFYPTQSYNSTQKIKRISIKRNTMSAKKARRFYDRQMDLDREKDIKLKKMEEEIRLKEVESCLHSINNRRRTLDQQDLEQVYDRQQIDVHIRKQREAALKQRMEEDEEYRLSKMFKPSIDKSQTSFRWIMKSRQSNRSQSSNGQTQSPDDRIPQQRVALKSQVFNRLETDQQLRDSRSRELQQFNDQTQNPQKQRPSFIKQDQSASFSQISNKSNSIPRPQTLKNSSIKKKQKPIQSIHIENVDKAEQKYSIICQVLKNKENKVISTSVRKSMNPIQKVDYTPVTQASIGPQKMFNSKFYNNNSTRLTELSRQLEEVINQNKSIDHSNKSRTSFINDQSRVSLDKSVSYNRERNSIANKQITPILKSGDKQRFSQGNYGLGGPRDEKQMKHQEGIRLYKKEVDVSRVNKDLSHL
eukprot:403369760